MNRLGRSALTGVSIDTFVVSHRSTPDRRTEKILNGGRVQMYARLNSALLGQRSESSDCSSRLADLIMYSITPESDSSRMLKTPSLAPSSSSNCLRTPINHPSIEPTQS
ncbi:hypothetical protein PGTUg99_034529 [Puccinia graminis f. sp. tritici]|uniref:Uncharacterized protein n=1 Tax=Puccinia graminis f. sp. tritici TaxID=56615 RepID=A0A5B0SL76_PUCGR|nr:hypothetical protein PGTUg99_034529 [Puccinia graminis f. sp. tritici]